MNAPKTLVKVYAHFFVPEGSLLVHEILFAVTKGGRVFRSRSRILSDSVETAHGWTEVEALPEDVDLDFIGHYYTPGAILEALRKEKG